MKNKLMLITGSHDATCDYIQGKFQDKYFFRLNLDLFSDYKIAIDNGSFQIIHEGLDICSDECLGIYFRKPIFENLEGVFDSAYHNFAHRETFSLIEGLVESFDGPCLSKPSKIRKANNKVFQLFLAEKLGFKVPASRITNNMEVVRDFDVSAMIVKPLAIGTVEHANHREYVQTNMVSKETPMDKLKFAPAYFQEYTEKDYEVRVTFVRDQAHAVRIESENKIDWRKKENNIIYRPYTLPSSIYLKCLDFMREADMEFGCFDFIVNNGEFVFLEMNANGQWAWLEKIPGCNVANSIIDYLSDVS
ncbi:hypothetical protein [Comamonas sp. A7-5]|uniref:hypothetical protein n=1 Tax=Comamonas sp. A7-5 TaxID=673549 RepID=UPI0031D2B206